MVLVTGTSGGLNASATVALTITAAPAFQSTGVNPAITIEPGATTGNTSTISVAGTNGYSGLVRLSCSISPSAANDPPTCSLSPSSLTLSGNAVQTATLTVNTIAPSSAKNDLKKLLGSSAGGASLALLIMVLVPRRRRGTWAVLGLLLFASFNLIGCGGGSVSGGGNPGTTAGTYTITVTGAGTPTGSSIPVTAIVGTVTLTVH
jgi:hypothetical protein